MFLKSNRYVFSTSKFSFEENHLLNRFIQQSLLISMTTLLIACGGGGSGGGASSPSTPSLSGVAAIGLALTKASVTLKDSTGKTETTTTD